MFKLTARIIVYHVRIQPMVNKNSDNCEIRGIEFYYIRHVDLVSIIYTTKIEGHKIVSLTLTSKINRQGHVIIFGLFEITDFDLVRIDIPIDIMSVSCMQTWIRKFI